VLGYRCLVGRRFQLKALDCRQSACAPSQPKVLGYLWSHLWFWSHLQAMSCLRGHHGLQFRFRAANRPLQRRLKSPAMIVQTRGVGLPLGPSQPGLDQVSSYRAPQHPVFLIEDQAPVVSKQSLFTSFTGTGPPQSRHWAHVSTQGVGLPLRNAVTVPIPGIGLPLFSSLMSQIKPWAATAATRRVPSSGLWATLRNSR